MKFCSLWSIKCLLWFNDEHFCFGPATENSVVIVVFCVCACVCIGAVYFNTGVHYYDLALKNIPRVNKKPSFVFPFWLMNNRYCSDMIFTSADSWYINMSQLFSAK